MSNKEFPNPIPGKPGMGVNVHVVVVENRPDRKRFVEFFKFIKDRDLFIKNIHPAQKVLINQSYYVEFNKTSIIEFAETIRTIINYTMD